MSGLNRCKEYLIEAKISNQEKMKQKNAELLHMESEVKSQKAMVTQKSNDFQEKKINLETLKRLNRSVNIPKLMTILHETR